MDSPSAPIFTIGHSSRPLDAFLALLDEAKIDCVVDVRRLPGSRSFSQYNADVLSSSLGERDIDYWHMDALCGRRTKRELDGVAPDEFWTNPSFARYATYARSDSFTHGLDELVQRGREQRCAVMCSEAVWWRCHRRIIADHLLALGVDVFHIMGPATIVAAELTRGAQIRSGSVVYPQPEAAKSQ